MSQIIRECTPADVPHIVNYFHDAEPAFWELLGIDPAKLPSREEWTRDLQAQLSEPVESKDRYYLICEVDGEAIGHSNLSDIEFGRVANMHLHLWTPDRRRRGTGTRFIRGCIDRYFQVFELDELLCEPHARNPAPNKTLPKLGFEYVDSWVGIPGAICYPQDVNRWRLPREKWLAMGRSATE